MNKATEDEWEPIMVSDEDGPCGIVALSHPLNARLIAQAPAMLEALRNTLACVNPSEYPEVVEQARAILRAVEGDTK